MARPTFSAAMVGSTIVVPFGWGTPRAIRAVMSVSALPMSIWPQAMSYARPSRAVDLVSPVIACLVEVYGDENGRGVWAEIEPLLMMRPPRGLWLFMIRNASWVHRNEPVRLVSTTARHCSTERSSRGMAGAPIPALLNRRSSRPKTSTVRVKRARMDSGSVTSVGTTIARPPVDPISDATSFRGSGRRPDTTTANSSQARASAAARPTPVPPPVMTATFVASPSALIRLSPVSRPSQPPIVSPVCELPVPGTSIHHRARYSVPSVCARASW